MARPLKERIAFQLDSIRRELIATVSPIDDIHYAPAEGMKSYRALLIEIGGEEVETAAMLFGKPVTREEADAAVAGSTTNELLDSLSLIRQSTLAYLEQADNMQRTIPLAEEWRSYFGDKEWEAEEFLRALALHEYYHLGQIVSYRWIQGHNPYKR